MSRTAKLFRNGASQAVRLPADFRFEGDEVFISRDAHTGDVILSARPRENTWEDFFAFLNTIDIPDDFMADRPLNTPPEPRDIFGEDV